MNRRSKPVLFCAGLSRKELVEFSLSSSATSHYVEFSLSSSSTSHYVEFTFTKWVRGAYRS